VARIILETSGHCCPVRLRDVREDGFYVLVSAVSENGRWMPGNVVVVLDGSFSIIDDGKFTAAGSINVSDKVRVRPLRPGESLVCVE
jgi:hypothetical protein